MGRPLTSRQSEILKAISTAHLTGVTPCANQLCTMLDPPMAAQTLTQHLRRLQRAGKVARYARTDKGILWKRVIE